MKKKVWYLLYLLLDIGIVLFAFAIVAWLRNGTRRVLVDYSKPVLGLSLAWVGAGFLGGKFSIKNKPRLRALWASIIKCDAIAIAVVFGAMFFFHRFQYSRYVTFGTIGLTIFIELIIFGLLYYSFQFHKDNPSFAKTTFITKSKKLEEEGSAYELAKFESSDKVPDSPVKLVKHYCLEDKKHKESIKQVLRDKYLHNDDKVFEFINKYLDLDCFCKDKALVLNSHALYNIENIEEQSQALFINLHKANNFRRINKYIIQVNDNLTQGGVFVGCVETKAQRRRRFIESYTVVFGNIFYLIDFFLRRVFPKIALLKGLYFFITKGKNRAFSETEILGRLYFCGFELLAKREIHGINYFIAIKTKEPSRDENPSYGPIIQLKRKGKNGKLLYVNKFRTMHPYSEYLQDYVYKTCSLQEGGKFKNDFRVTRWGKVFRKLWIDELPQFINFFKGELNLVGVRALSEHYFGLYPQDVRELRVKVKPGLLPPFYADMPKTFEEIVESERKYLVQKIERPVWTDFKYFWLVLWNILVKKARSN